MSKGLAEYNILVKTDLICKRYSAKRLRNMFANKDWNLGALKLLIDTKDTVDRRPDSGRPRTVRTTAIITKLKICH